MKSQSIFSKKSLIRLSSLLFLPILVLYLFSSCNKEEEPVGDPEFIGSENCKSCHSAKFNDWEASGHPYKFTIVENGVEPSYPAEAVNFQSQWMSELGDGSHSWDDVAGVIGGYGWKARFVGQDGIVMGSASSAYSGGQGHNQINFFGGDLHNWSNYETGTENKLYNYGCFKCHTTGGTQDGTWLEAVPGLGNFSEGGVGCESCHGPGSLHVDDPTKDNIDRVYEFAHADNAIGGLDNKGSVQTPDEMGDDVNFLCGTCHNRGYKSPIDASGGFIKHHEQWDEFMTTDHNAGGMTCISCHDPHKRTIWDGDGITKTCSSCHADQAAKQSHNDMANCVDCHMPFAAKSGTKIGESGYRGDVRSHLMRITVNTESMFTEDGSAVRDDAERPASLSPAHVCLGCHNDDPDDNNMDMTVEAAAMIAKDMHK